MISGTMIGSISGIPGVMSLLGYNTGHGPVRVCHWACLYGLDHRTCYRTWIKSLKNAWTYTAFLWACLSQNIERNSMRLCRRWLQKVGSGGARKFGMDLTKLAKRFWLFRREKIKRKQLWGLPRIDKVVFLNLEELVLDNLSWLVCRLSRYAREWCNSF